MKVAKRVENAWRALKGEKGGIVTPDRKISIPEMYADAFSRNGGTTLATDMDEVSAYEGQLPWVSVAVDRITADVASQPYYFCDVNGNVIEDRRLPDEIKTPFELGWKGISFVEMMKFLVPNRLLAGNSYLWPITGTAYGASKGMVDTFIPLGAHQVQIMKNSNGIGVEYYQINLQGSQFRVAPDEIIPFRQNTVLDPFVGIGNIGKLRLSAEGDIAAAEYINAFMVDSKGMPITTFLDKTPMEDNEKKRMSDMLKSKWGPRILYMNVEELEIVQSSLFQKDMNFMEMQGYSRQTTLSVFGVPPTVAGIPDANYATAYEAGIRYLGRTVNPILNELADDITRKFVHKYDKRIFFKFKLHPTGNIDDITKKLAAGIITPNQASAALGEAVDENDASRECYYMPANLIPMGSASLIGQDGMAIATPAPVAQGVDIQSTALNGAQVTSLLEVINSVATGVIPASSANAIIRAAFPSVQPSDIAAMLSKIEVKPPVEPTPVIPNEGKVLRLNDPKNVDLICAKFLKSATHPKQFQEKFIRAALKSRNAVEDRYTAKLSEFFDEQKKRVLSNLNNEKSLDVKVSAELIFDYEAETKRLRDEVKGLHTSALQRAIGDINVLTGSTVNLNLSNPFVAAALNNVGAKIVGKISETTKEGLSKLVEKSVNDGWTINQLQDEISGKFDSWSGYRARMIARTESRSAWDAGAQVAYKEIGVKTVDIVGCTEFETDSDCGKQNVSVEDIASLEFHPNHIGCPAPSEEP